MSFSYPSDYKYPKGDIPKWEGTELPEGGMTLYLKAAEDGQSVGDCPFAHNVRMVLEEKGLDYDLKPTSPDGKPRWLLEYYDGKMPALRHRKECYVESSVIVDYLEYFFPEPSLTPKDDHGAADVLDGFFPAVAKFLKDTEDSDETTNNLKTKLQSFEDHLSKLPDGSFLCGQDFTLLDCRVVPQLYHLQVGIDGYKNGLPALAKDFPKTYAYMQTCFARPSFQASNYPAETVLWGWGNARK
ncbi:glutathione S-transferase [Nitzschia inconspicua]|uniref:Glutathione S-transferase n=1 Tax=Nitzschia inconspicua TaxID=303405 RepID=A0A9K3LBS5_9STRA|nr:glutathione S-transferase [Nitzschia inconspicua]